MSTQLARFLHVGGNAVLRFRIGWLVVASALSLVVTGCRTAGPNLALAEAKTALGSSVVLLNPGDVVQVTFPGAATMNTTQRIQLNGMLQMPLIREIKAAGRTPSELQEDISKAYDKQLQVKEVLVIVTSSSASIFVAGAVVRPGRINMERPMTVLDAIMEAGGFDPRRANVRKVSVIRQSDGKYTQQTLNLKPILHGENVEPFNLKPFDVVYVPEKLF